MKVLKALAPVFLSVFLAFFFFGSPLGSSLPNTLKEDVTNAVVVQGADGLEGLGLRRTPSQHYMSQMNRACYFGCVFEHARVCQSKESRAAAVGAHVALMNEALLKEAQDMCSSARGGGGGGGVQQ